MQLQIIFLQIPPLILSLCLFFSLVKCKLNNFLIAIYNFTKKKQKPFEIECKNAYNENDFQEYFAKYKVI